METNTTVVPLSICSHETKNTDEHDDTRKQILNELGYVFNKHARARKFHIYVYAILSALKEKPQCEPGVNRKRQFHVIALYYDAHHTS